MMFEIFIQKDITLYQCKKKQYQDNKECAVRPGGKTYLKDGFKEGEIKVSRTR